MWWRDQGIGNVPKLSIPSRCQLLFWDILAKYIMDNVQSSIAVSNLGTYIIATRNCHDKTKTGRITFSKDSECLVTFASLLPVTYALEIALYTKTRIAAEYRE